MAGPAGPPPLPPGVVGVNAMPAQPYPGGPPGPPPGPQGYPFPPMGAPYQGPALPLPEIGGVPGAPDAENNFIELAPVHGEPYVPAFRLDFEYLHWYVQRQPTPTLVTTGSVNDTIPGALGQPSTRVLLNEVTIGSGHDGARFTAGYDFGSDHQFGVDGSFFILSNNNRSANFTSSGSTKSPLIARPFYNVVSGAQDSDPIGIPGVQSGSLTVTTPQRLFGGEVNGRMLLTTSTVPDSHWGLIAGIRYLSMDEKLLIDENEADVPGLGTPGNRLVLNENFTTYNRFYGGQIGTEWEKHFGRLYAILRLKVAAGETDEKLKISGSTTQYNGDGTVTFAPNQALYVSPANVGSRTQNQFTIVPEANFHVGFVVSENIRLTAGYDGLYWSNVLRPGKQVNQHVNVQPLGSPVPLGPIEPQPLPLANSGLWAQGWNLGVEFQF
jgi:hypothetical protein